MQFSFNIVGITKSLEKFLSDDMEKKKRKEKGSKAAPLCDRDSEMCTYAKQSAYISRACVIVPSALYVRRGFSGG